MENRPVFGAGCAEQKKRRSLRQRGVVLLDAIVAVVIAVLIIVYGISLMMSSASSSDGAKQTTIAYNAARQQIENIRSFRGAPLANRSNAALIPPMPQLAELTAGTGSLTIENYRGPVKKAVVRITWRSGGRPATRTITVTTLISPGGVTP